MLFSELQQILNQLDSVYALIDEQGTIQGHSAPFANWLAEPGAPVSGQSVWDVVPELIGYETVLAAVRHGQQPVLRIDQINRAAPDGSVRYLSLIATPAPQGECQLLLLVTDTSITSNLLQVATQSRNELQLVRRELARINGQLDYVVQQYLPAEVAAALMNGTLRPSLGGELREISILFADVRGYTTLSERLGPNQLIGVLNSYLTVVIDEIDGAGGTLVQIQGDAIMAIFNAPVAQPDHAERAVRAACAIQRAVGEHSAIYADRYPPLAFGIGVNTGAALVGNSGAAWRMVYTAIGDPVNLAARITAAAPPGAVWVSEATATQLSPVCARVDLPPLIFKGKSQSTALFAIPVQV